MIKSQLITKCLVNQQENYKIVDLGMHPFADTFISQELLSFAEPIFPLECALNPESGQVQVRYISNDYDRYNLYAYSYTSSNSLYSRSHWDEYYETMISRFDLKNKFIVEIGSNDGYLCNKFINNTKKVLGIDSSKEMCRYAKTQNKIKTENLLFSYENSFKILKEYGKADLIIANNVFNHSNDPLGFARGVNNLLSDNGIFVYELPYWKDTVQSCRFDQIYHEHISYFTVKSSYEILKECNLEIVDVQFIDYHGGSIRVFSKKANKVLLDKKIHKLIETEKKEGLFELKTYFNFERKIQYAKFKFLQKIFKLKNENPNSIIIGVGAAAKANTLINYYKLDNQIINYISDSSVFKQGKFTPLSRIPIVDDNIFSKFESPIAIILSWNISSSLKLKLLNINKKIKFINL